MTAKPRGPHDTERRWADARRLLHDASLELPDPVAGLLLLLHDLSPVDIARPTAEDVDDDGTVVKLTIGAEPIVLPYPPARLIRDVAATRRGRATIGRPATVAWLFPVGRPGQPLDGGRLAGRLRNIGLHPRNRQKGRRR